MKTIIVTEYPSDFPQYESPVYKARFEEHRFSDINYGEGLSEAEAIGKLVLWTDEFNIERDFYMKVR